MEDRLIHIKARKIIPNEQGGNKNYTKSIPALG